MLYLVRRFEFTDAQRALFDTAIPNFPEAFRRQRLRSPDRGWWNFAARRRLDRQVNATTTIGSIAERDGTFNSRRPARCR
jgi:hypothetical protein